MPAYAVRTFVAGDMDDAERADFEQAVGECFADAVCPPVPFEQASAHECFEAVSEVLPEPSPKDFASLSAEQVDRLALSFSDWFECAPPSRAQVRSSVAALLARWPPG